MRTIEDFKNFDGNDTDVLMTIEEAADFLRYTKNTMNWKRVHGGGPDYVKFDGRVCYRLSALRAFLVDMPARKRRV